MSRTVLLSEWRGYRQSLTSHLQAFFAGQRALAALRS